jgi:hypothetical protein
LTALIPEVGARIDNRANQDVLRRCARGQPMPVIPNPDDDRSTRILDSEQCYLLPSDDNRVRNTGRGRSSGDAEDKEGEQNHK